MKTCFVIQPFDDGKFDRRYNDVFAPTIIDSGLQPYRVDKDPGTKILIEDIESGIKNAEIILADITLDNPNVWYELGYAVSSKKEIVMVCCSEERPGGKFPFDIQHRSIIPYKTGSKSDFTDLETKIKDKILSYLERSKTVETINDTPVQAINGLKGHEVAILLILMGKNLGTINSTPTNALNNYMDKSGYNPIATGVGLVTLSKYGLIERFETTDYESGYDYLACKLTQNGEDWILANQHLIQFEKRKDI